jgi:hypothetical protein
MPSTRIETQRGWIGERKLEFIEAVQRALSDALKLPSDDRCVRLFEYDDDTIIAPPGERFLLYGGGGTAFFRPYGPCQAAALRWLGEGALAPWYSRLRYQTILAEALALDWGLHGKAASDIDLGYKIDV